MKLQAKLLLLFLACGVFILAAMGMLLFSQLKNDQIAILQNEVAKQLENLDFAMAAFFDEAKNDIRALAADRTVRSRDDSGFTSFLNADETTFVYRMGPLEKRIVDILNTFRNTHPYVNSVYMGRVNAFEQTEGGRQTEGGPDWGWPSAGAMPG